jgi:hypothetical protein
MCCLVLSTGRFVLNHFCYLLTGLLLSLCWIVVIDVTIYMTITDSKILSLYVIVIVFTQHLFPFGGHQSSQNRSSLLLFFVESRIYIYIHARVIYILHERCIT